MTEYVTRYPCAGAAPAPVTVTARSVERLDAAVVSGVARSNTSDAAPDDRATALGAIVTITRCGEVCRLPAPTTTRPPTESRNKPRTSPVASTEIVESSAKNE